MYEFAHHVAVGIGTMLAFAGCSAAATAGVAFTCRAFKWSPVDVHVHVYPPKDAA